MPPPLSPEDLLRAQYIAKIKVGAASDILIRIDELDTQRAELPEFIYIKGLALAYSGALEQAVKLWESLHADGLWSEDLVAELAAAYLALSRPERAEALLLEWQAASSTPLSQKTAEHLIEALLSLQMPHKAATAADLATKYLADKPLALGVAKARAAVWLKDWPAVCSALLPLTTNKSTAVDLSVAGEMLRTQGHLAESLAILKHAISTERSSIEIWRQLAKVMWQSGDEDGAMGLLADAFELHSEDPTLLEAIVRMCIDDRSYELAGIWLTRLEAILTQDDVIVRTLAAEVMLGLGDLQSVADFLTSEDDADTCLDAARVAYYSRINQPDMAIMYQDRIVTERNRSVESLLARARLSASAGRGSEVPALAEEVLQRLPNSLAASMLLVAQSAGGVELAHLNRLRRGLHGGRMPARQRAAISHSLADYHHATKDYAIAAELYAYCNKLNEPPAGQRYDCNKHHDWQRSIATAFTDAESPPTTTSGKGSMLPVFVVGVPRSGTTLTEQILARHPDVTGMGECQHVSLSFSWLSDFKAQNHDVRSPQNMLAQCSKAELAQLRERFLALLTPHATSAPGAGSGRQLFVDKMPDNYGLIGWIFTLLPEAKIIYAQRDPREIALSCWKANFGAINWAYRIEDIADRIVQHHKIMALWMNQFGSRIFTSDYKQLVSDPEGQTRKMLEYLELEWSDACLDHTQASSVVRTASINQVRRPVYKTSLQAWQHYEEALSPAIAIFEKTQLNLP